MGLDSIRRNFELLRHERVRRLHGLHLAKYQDATGIVHRALWDASYGGWVTLCNDGNEVAIAFIGGRPGPHEDVLEKSDAMLTCLTCIAEGG